MPFRSTTTWRLVPDLPRFVGFGLVLMPYEGQNTRRAQHRPRPSDLLCRLQTFEQPLMQLGPNTGTLGIP